MKYLLTILFILSTPIYAQHNIPFYSKDNIIELSIMNESNVQINNLSIKAIKYPSWVVMQNPEQKIKVLSSSKEDIVEFSFSVDKTAVVNKEESISFTITTPSGEVWTKQVKIVVTPPERFELYQNYPNPFNPKTIISFQLPHAEHVVLKIFDIVGREVRTVLNEVKEAGYYEVELSTSGEASDIASGVYFYKMTSGNFVKFKKMVLLR